MKTRFKIAVVNLQSGIGTTKGYWEYFVSAWKYLLPGKDDFILLAAETLKREQVDIALLTEVNEISFRSGKSSQIKVLENALVPMESAFFPTIRSGNHIHEGNAVLSRYPIEKSVAHALPRFTIPRFLGETKIRIGEQKVNVFVAHLSVTASRRKRQLEAVGAILSKKDGPIILGGDFNEREVHVLEELLHTGLTTILTEKSYPSWKPKHSLDYLLVSDHFSVHNCYIPESIRFSDHAPIVVDLEIH
ncbi:MAG: endonuclease/exonuclease/phosphatase family protein [Patescibacteria group bacterium]